MTDNPHAAAIPACEDYLNLVLVARDETEALPIRWGWQTLKLHPVRSIDAPIITEVDIDANGTGHVRFFLADGDGTIDINYRVGMAERFQDLPEAIRTAVERHAAALTADPDALLHPDVCALLRPYRRLVLA